MLPADPNDTEALLEAIKAGSRSALETLFHLHRPYLKRVVELRMDPAMLSRLDPSDVVQETQLAVTRRIDDFLRRRPCTFRLWLRRKALEQLIDQRRRHVGADKRSVRRETAMTDASSLAIARTLLSETPSFLMRQAEFAEQVRALIDQLSEADREVLTLRHVESLTTAEVAELLKISPNTVRQRYGRALRRLHEKLSDAGLSLGAL